MLIADDDLVSRRILQAALSSLGHDVVAVEDGTAAIACLERADSPRIAILDWMMPGADGLTVCRTVRERGGPYTYVILLTAREGRHDMVAGFDAGVDDFLTKPLDVVELRARLRSGERIVALQADLLHTQDQLRHQASHDPLTGLWNRGHILDQLGRELLRTRREDTTLAVLLVDIDHFKAVNDRFGHAAGDVVLRETGRRMHAALRTTDMIGRYGGEEFLIVLPRADLDGGVDVAERLRAAVCAAPMLDGPEAHTVSVSVGVAGSAMAGHDASRLVGVADEALYRAKALGRNRVESAAAVPLTAGL
jgi:two-component system, cell cycle response regulator